MPVHMDDRKAWNLFVETQPPGSIDLSGCAFSEKTFRGYLFTACILRDAVFERCTFIDCDFRHADLSRARFDEHCSYSGLDFSHAKLNATLFQGEAQGLVHADWCKADLKGATLPFDISQVNQSFVGMARLLVAPLILLISAALFVCLQEINHFELVNNSNIEHIPFYSKGMAVRAFIWLFPLLILGLHIHIQVQLQVAWKKYQSLPSIFPNGKPRYVNLFPLTPLLLQDREHSLWSRKLRRSFGFILEILPFIIFFKIMLMQAPLHHIATTLFLIVVVVLALSLSIYSFNIRRERRPVLFGPLRLGIFAGLVSCMLMVAVFFFLKAPWAHLVLYKPAGGDALAQNQPASYHWPTFNQDLLSLGNLNFAEISGFKFGALEGFQVQLNKATLTNSSFSGCMLNTWDLDGAHIRAKDEQGVAIPAVFLSGSTLFASTLRDVMLEQVRIEDSTIKSCQWERGTLKDTQFIDASMRHTSFLGSYFSDVVFEGKSKRMDVTGCDFSASVFQVVRFTNCSFVKVNMENANCNMLEFFGVDFYDCQMKGIDTQFPKSEQTISFSDFSHSALAHSDFTATTITSSNFSHSKLFRAQFFKVIESKFNEIEGLEASFADAVLTHVFFTDANLGKANFSGSTLQAVDFQKAKLKKAQFVGAKGLPSCNFQGANLNGADFTGSDLQVEQISDAQYDKATRFPFPLPVKP